MISFKIFIIICFVVEGLVHHIMYKRSCTVSQLIYNIFEINENNIVKKLIIIIHEEKAEEITAVSVVNLHKL